MRGLVINFCTKTVQDRKGHGCGCGDNGHFFSKYFPTIGQKLVCKRSEIK